jgi:hypothetical protein
MNLQEQISRIQSMMGVINETRFFRRRINLDKVQGLIQKYAKEVFYEAESFEQFKYEVVLKAVEWIMWVEYEIGWDELPEQEEIDFVTYLSNKFEDMIEGLYNLYSKTINEGSESMMGVNESKGDKKLEKHIISGKKFKKKYATDFNGKVAKVFYTQNLNIGSNLGKGSYWNVTQDSLDIYSGERDEELDSDYGDYVKDIVYKEIDDNLKIFVKDDIADELWDNEKLYNKIKNISDGIYDPVYDDYGLLLFKNI